MKKETKQFIKIFTITFVVLSLLIGIFLYAFIIYPEQKKVIYKLTDYSCEELKQSIKEATCLISVESSAWTSYLAGCFHVEEKVASYDIRCKKEVSNENKSENESSDVTFKVNETFKMVGMGYTENEIPEGYVKSIVYEKVCSIGITNNCVYYIKEMFVPERGGEQ